MIVETILGAIFGILNGFVALFPSIDVSIPADVLSAVNVIVSSCCYFLPMDTVVGIFGIVFIFNIFKICIAFVKTIISFIPFF